MASQHQPPPTPEEISARALELWRIAGSPAGGADAFRAAAESELRKHREMTARTADDPASQGPERPQR